MKNVNRYLPIAVIAVLLVGMTYYYIATNDEIANLKSANQTICQEDRQLATFAASILGNVTAVLQMQIRNDNSMIDALNSTKPSGYTGMIATLNNEIGQDNSIVNSIGSQVTIGGGHPGSSGPPGCSTFGP